MAWGSLAKLFSRFASSGAGKTAVTWSKTWTANGVKNVQVVSKVASEAVQAGAKTAISWGSALKVALVGGFGYLFLTGGASNAVSKVLGISPAAAQILIIFGFVVVMLLVLRYLVNYLRDRHGLRTEYLEEPITRHFGPMVWDEGERRWVRRRSP